MAFDETPHGEFTIEKTGRVIHTYPEGGFNAQGIKRVHEAILKASENEPVWILYEHPLGKAGVTPDAVDELVRSYLKFSKLGCIGIAMEVETIWGQAISNKLGDNFPLPHFFSPEKDNVDRWLLELSQDL